MSSIRMLTASHVESFPFPVRETETRLSMAPAITFERLLGDGCTHFPESMPKQKPLHLGNHVLRCIYWAVRNERQDIKVPKRGKYWSETLSPKEHEAPRGRDAGTSPSPPGPAVRDTSTARGAAGPHREERPRGPRERPRSRRPPAEPRPVPGVEAALWPPQASGPLSHMAAARATNQRSPRARLPPRRRRASPRRPTCLRPATERVIGRRAAGLRDTAGRCLRPPRSPLASALPSPAARLRAPPRCLPGAVVLGAAHAPPDGARGRLGAVGRVAAGAAGRPGFRRSALPPELFHCGEVGGCWQGSGTEVQCFFGNWRRKAFLPVSGEHPARPACWPPPRGVAQSHWPSVSVCHLHAPLRSVFLSLLGLAIPAFTASPHMTSAPQPFTFTPFHFPSNSWQKDLLSVHDTTKYTSAFSFPTNSEIRRSSISCRIWC